MAVSSAWEKSSPLKPVVGPPKLMRCAPSVRLPATATPLLTKLVAPEYRLLAVASSVMALAAVIAAALATLVPLTQLVPLMHSVPRALTGATELAAATRTSLAVLVAARTNAPWALGEVMV